LASSAMMTEAPADSRTLLFRVADAVYGCEMAGVREIIPYRRATRLPGAPPFVQGLVNLRGTIVTVLDIGMRLDPTRAPVREGSIILATFGTRVVGVAVDEVMDVQPIVAEPIATSAPDAHPGLVRGLGHLNDGVVVLVDIHVLITQVLL
jgi:purine-binding chemotaxis protein CheW